MAEQPVIHIRENSPEHVAFKPMEMIANVENVALSCSTDRDRTSATRGVEPQYLQRLHSDGSCWKSLRLRWCCFPDSSKLSKLE